MLLARIPKKIIKWLRWRGALGRPAGRSRSARVLRPTMKLTIPLLCVAATPPSDASATRPWLDATLSPDRRTALLLAQMTLEEKVAQLGYGGCGELHQTQLLCLCFGLQTHPLFFCNPLIFQSLSFYFCSLLCFQTSK